MTNRILGQIEERWPTFGFLSLGLLWGWLDVQTSSFVLFPADTVEGAMGLETHLYWLSLSMTAAFLVGIVSYRLADASFRRSGFFAAAALVLCASVACSALANAGLAPDPIAFAGAVLAGLGSAWFMMAFANAYLRLKPKDLFISVGLSKVVGIACYFITCSLPPALSIASLAATPFFIALLSCRANRPRALDEGSGSASAECGAEGFFARTSDEMSALGISKRSVLKLSMACFVVFFIAVLTKQEGLSFSDSFASATSFQLINFGTLLLSLLLVVIVAAPPKHEPMALAKGFYAAIAVIVILFIATTLGSYHSSAFSWISGSLRNMLDALMFAISALLIRRLHTSTAQTYGLVCGFPVCLGGFLGHALVNNPLLSGTDQVYFLTLGIDLVALILLFTVFTPRDLELLLAVGITEPAGKTPTPARNASGSDAEREMIEQANFSAREAEVFELLMKGYTIRLISQELHISQSTVKTHISKIYLKMNVATREELLVKLKG